MKRVGLAAIPLSIGAGLVLFLAALVSSAPPVGRARAAGAVQQLSAGVWDATPYVNRDLSLASLHRAVVGTDDSRNITRALADMIRAGCTTLYIPGGYYRINTPIALPAGAQALNIRIIGAGSVGTDHPATPPNCWTVLCATNGNAIFDWNAVQNCTWEGIAFYGYTGFTTNNPAPPPYLVRLQAGVGTTSGNTFRNCSFFYAVKGIQYGNGNQNNVDRCLMDHCSFFGLAYGYVQSSDQALDCVMRWCCAANVGSVAQLERGGHFQVTDNFIATACGDGLPGGRQVNDGVTNNGSAILTSATANFTPADADTPLYGSGIPAGAVIARVVNATTVVMSSAATATAGGVSVVISGPYGDPSHVTNDHKYWVFFLSTVSSGVNVETITIENFRAEAGTSQIIYCAGRHEISVVNIDLTQSAGFGASGSAGMFAINSSTAIRFFGGYIYGPSGGTSGGGPRGGTAAIALGVSNPSCQQTFYGTTFENLPNATAGGKPSDLHDCRYINNGAWAPAPSSL